MMEAQTTNNTQNFIPRFYQRDPLRAMTAGGFMRAMLVYHRGGGKEKTCWIFMGDRAANHRVGNYQYWFPTYPQAKRGLWNNIDGDGFRTLNHLPPPLWERKVDSPQPMINLRNGSTLEIMAGDEPRHIDHARGSNPVGVVLSEWAFMNPYVWEAVRPRLELNGGWAIFNTTPNGDNHAADMWRMALDNPEWFTQLCTVDDTGALAEAEARRMIRDTRGVRIYETMLAAGTLDAAVRRLLARHGEKALTARAINRERREGMPEEMIQQEYYCSFEGVRTGSYYGAILAKAEREGRIGAFPHVPGIPVDTWWDIGFGDATAIWFVQEVHGVPRAIEYHEASGLGIEDYISHLQQRQREAGYVYRMELGQIIAHGPHDIASGEWLAGESRQAKARELGVKFLASPKAKNQAGLDDQIEATARLLHVMCFDAGPCKQGLSALRNYARKWDEARKVFMRRPSHDWASHGADALRTGAVAHRRFAKSTEDTETAQTSRAHHAAPGSGPQTGWLGR